MRVRTAVLSVSVLALIAPGAASADFVHVVAPGETLTSVAAADGLSVAAVAAANGLSPTAQLISGSGIQIPAQNAAVSTPAQPSPGGDGDADGDDPASTPVPVSSSPAPAGGGGAYVVQPGDTLSAIAARAGVSVDQLAAANGLDPSGVLLAGSVLRQSAAAPVNSATANVGGGSYVVAPGDTLAAIAARAGTSIAQLAADNGLDPNGLLLAGSVLRLSGSATFVSNTTSTASAASQPVGAAAQGSVVDPPYPTPQSLSAGEIASIAQAHGVSPSLADAIAWQESGFNNDLVSSADARGIMQILPGTWQWIQNDLNPAGPPLAPASATDNVRGGVLMLRSLLDSTGGDPAMAAAGYYQGLPSVQQNGVYPGTQQYINSVMALRQQFGGG